MSFKNNFFLESCMDLQLDHLQLPFSHKQEVTCSETDHLQLNQFFYDLNTLVILVTPILPKRKRLD